MITVDTMKAFRAKYHFSQGELADATALHRGYISAVEQGRREVTEHLSNSVESFIAFVAECDADGRL